MYSQITSNKRKTWVLVSIFSVFATALVWLLLLQFSVPPEEGILIATAVAVIYSTASYYFSDRAVLSSNRAKPLAKRDNPELYRLVENLSITAGIPTPKIYVINDPSPNAFATGRDPHHATVTFTTGILSLLNKQELEGVAAHEISHIKNFDIRVMTIVVGLVGLVILVSEILLRVNFLRNSRSKEARQMMIFFMLFGFLLAILSPLIAQVIKLAVSRSREYLADANGALLTRYPQGLAEALRKMRDHASPLKHANDATAHLFISDPFGGKKKKTPFMHKLFMTHPPIDDRIAKLTGMNK
jgi:heat shock protein HtpX